MNVKKILMFAAMSAVAVVVGLAIVNRLKAKVPQLSAIMGA